MLWESGMNRSVEESGGIYYENYYLPSYYKDTKNLPFSQEFLALFSKYFAFVSQYRMGFQRLLIMPLILNKLSLISADVLVSDSLSEILGLLFLLSINDSTCL